MTFRIMTPPPQRKPKFDSTDSPTFSTLGRSPSIVPPAYTTDDLLAARNQKISRWVYLTRLGITAITLAASITVIACAGVSLSHYSNSHLAAEWLLPLWPLNVDLRPTHTVLGCGITVAVLSLVYLAAAFAPMGARKMHTLNIVSTVLSFVCLAMSLFTTIFASIITHNLSYSTSQGTLNSWTCKWQGFESVAPAKFTAICNEGLAALDLVIFLVIMEVLAVGVAAWGWWVVMRMKRGSVEMGRSQVELVKV